MRHRIRISGNGLQLKDVEPVVMGQQVQVSIAPQVMQRVRRSRKTIEQKVAKQETVYGVTTGFGKLAKVRIPNQDLKRLQRNLIHSHATGVGPILPAPEVRCMILFRLNSLTRGYSGVRPEVIETLAALLNRDVIPVIPEQGSVGASGDLAPLAHLAMVILGEGEAYYQGKRMSGGRALKAAKIAALDLQAKEGLALVNGTQMMTGIGVSVFVRACNLVKLADVIASLSVEALQGSAVPFDARIAKLRPHPGHTRTAENMRKCLAGSQVIPSHKNCEKVQDPYSLRCIPQVHGAVKDVLAHVGEVLLREINSVTDNPLVFPEQNQVLSGGNFHGQPIAAVLDYLAIGLSTIGTISERRIENMVNPSLSGLPPFLVAQSGINSGFMIPQVVAASLVSENKIHAHPASVDTIPTSANQEDHVSMGVTAARKARAILQNVERILAIELMCAAQAREFNKKLRAGRGAEAVYKAARKRVPALQEDRFLAPDLEKLTDSIVRGELVAEVEKQIGKLHY